MHCQISWQDHSSALCGVLQAFKEKELYFDCQLICKGGLSIGCHRLVLSSCSPFFKQIIQDFPLENPTITLDGITEEELKALITYIYTGETCVPVETVKSFFSICKSFQIGNFKDFDIVNDDEPMDFNSEANLLQILDLPALDFDSQYEIGDDLCDTDELNFLENDLDIDQSDWNTLETETEENNEPPRRKKFQEMINKIRSNDENKLDNCIIDLGKEVKRRYKCRKCGGSYSHKRTINHHIEWICDRPATFACKLCPYRGKRKYQLRSHLQHFHRDKYPSS